MAEENRRQKPVYNHNHDALSPQNRAAAKMRGWKWDPDYHDWIDEDGYLVNGAWHVPRKCDIRCN